jgi:hypothetical protein
VPFGSRLENGEGSFQGHLDPVRTVPASPARIFHTNNDDERDDPRRPKSGGPSLRVPPR